MVEGWLPRRFLGPRIRVRVDLHGISVFGRRRARTVIRWEAIKAIEQSDGIAIRSNHSTIHLPAGSFGLDPEDLGSLLDEARSIEVRPDLIGRLAARSGVDR